MAYLYVINECEFLLFFTFLRGLLHALYCKVFSQILSPLTSSSKHVCVIDIVIFILQIKRSVSFRKRQLSFSVSYQHSYTPSSIALIGHQL